MLRMTNLKLSLDDAINESIEIVNLKTLVFSKYQVKTNDFVQLMIVKKAIDARRKSNVHFVYTIDVTVKNESKYLKKSRKHISKSPDLSYQTVESGSETLRHRPVIVGFGPSGVFSALLLARRGYKPLVLERGLDVQKRTKEWQHFIHTGEFSEHASNLFGEGGAGTFSDGKLTTSIKNLRCRFILEELIKAGANPDILYLSKPHVGTDILKIVIKNIRNEIVSLGGEIRFESKVTDFEIEQDTLKAVIVNDEERILTNVCLLGIGHSARDTFNVLLSRGIDIKQKPFAIGVRIEHDQTMINKSQYGAFHDHPALGAADYKLSYHSKNGRSAYTFCMCPGGFVVNSSSEEKGIVTNGMSYSARDGKNANAALLVNVTPDDFPSNHPLAGIEFQRQFEQLAFDIAGKNYHYPLQCVGDFLKDQNTKAIGLVKPTIQPGYSFVKMQEIYPSYITNTLKEALVYFDKRIKGYASDDALLTGPETRSSSPVKITRNDRHETHIKGLYPMGEGAGYAGGIMSAAVDGIKTAESIIRQFRRCRN